MKMPESFFSRTVLAYLPFMAYSVDPEAAWVVAALIAIVYWLTLAIFWFPRRLFPAGTGRPVFFLWLGLWAQAAWTLLGLFPLWIVSVFLLVPAGSLEESRSTGRSGSGAFPKYFSERLLNGLGFFVFAAGLEVAGGFLGNFGRSAALRGPAGIFFLVFLAAFLWKNQPASKKNFPVPPARAGRR